MSGNHEATIREGIAALNRGDADGIASMLDPEVELVPLRAVLDGSVYRGHDGMRRWLADMSEDWAEFELTAEEVRDLGPERVLVQATMRLRGQSGVALSSAAAWLCDMRGGKVSRIRFYEHAAAALVAAEE